MDTKFGPNVSNRILLKAAKFQGYGFYRFWVSKGKSTEGGKRGGGVNYSPLPTQIKTQ